MNLKEINERISDRDECFYWQTDRKISAEEAGLIWKDRHSAITNDYLLEKINEHLTEDKLIFIKPFDETAQTSLGNVNSIRVGILESGQEVIIRCHPKGVKNGYFESESLASNLALNNGLPAYKTYTIHDLESENDISYQVIEKLKGDTVQFYLKQHPEQEEKLVFEMGKTMAKLHKIQVTGFGPFDNELSKQGKLIGMHNSLQKSITAGLDENLERLVKYNILSKEVADKMRNIFKDNQLLDYDSPVLVHNDFADWNLLTDGNTITGIIDWDECVAGHPIQEIACWSTFFEPTRIKAFLEGYFSETKKEENFEELFQLFRLRYTISKMALRIKRYTYEQNDFLKSMIEKGTKHLEELCQIFNLTTDDKKYMDIAIELSSQAYYPYGAIIVKDNKIIGRSDSKTTVSESAFSHAELRAIEDAMDNLGGHLCAEGGKDCTIYSSCEPCAMCMGAILYTGIERLVYGATLEDSKECVNDILAHASDVANTCTNRKISITPEFEREQAVKVLKSWKEKN